MTSKGKGGKDSTNQSKDTPKRNSGHAAARKIAAKADKAYGKALGKGGKE